MSNFIYFDFEFNDNLVLLCALKWGDVVLTFDCRNPKDVSELKEIIETTHGVIWVSYSLGAEISSLLRLGINVENLKCVDLMVECRMITMSHSKYFTKDSSLLGQVSCLLGKDTTQDKIKKDQMREVILSKNAWVPQEWRDIVKYCIEDLSELRNLFLRVYEIHSEANHPYLLATILNRGDYVRKSAEMDFASNGFPIDKEAVNIIFSQREIVKRKLIRSLPDIWRQCFTTNKTSFTLRQDLLEEVIRNKGWKSWRRTDTGKLSLDADYLKEISRRWPEVSPLKYYRQTENTLRSADLRAKIVNGYIKPRTSPFTAVTGRNGLEPTKGYLLNLPKWIRKIIHPQPGKIIISADWSQQEIAIGAALSKDVNLIEAYNSGDIYLAMAKLAKKVPEDATKKSHPSEREQFKALQLALGYGKGIKALGLDFQGILGGGEAQALSQAREIHSWHQRAFKDYWAWAKNTVNDSYNLGWIESVDGWVEWVGINTKKTQLLNFPMQSNGAVMMRKATLRFYDYWKQGLLPPLLCSQHDGFYFNAEENNLDLQSKLVKDIMEEVSQELIGLIVRADVTIYNNKEGYIPKGWEGRFQEVWDLCTKEEGNKI